MKIYNTFPENGTTTIGGNDKAGPVAEATATRDAGLGPDEDESTLCHATTASQSLLDLYAIETPICCGLTFAAHDEHVTDHVVDTRRIWNAQLHDLVDEIERQARHGAWFAGYEYGRGSWAPTEMQRVPWWRRLLWRVGR